MNTQDKNILISLGIAVAVILITRPANTYSKKSDVPDKVAVPDSEEGVDFDKMEKADESILAYKLALKDGASKQTLSKLNETLSRENGITVSVSTGGKLVAKDLNGKTIITEK